MSLKGEVIVVDAVSGKILAVNPMADGENGLRSSLPVSHGNLFVRTTNRLYCIGK